MHYQDGTPAQLGDIVRGQGYNLPHEIIGTVVGLIPGAISCNLRVTTTRVRRIQEDQGLQVVGLVYRDQPEAPAHVIEPIIEFGAAADFTLLHRPSA